MINPLEEILGGAQLPESAAKERCEDFFHGGFPLPEPPPPETLPPWLRNAFAEAALFCGIIAPDDPLPQLAESWMKISPFGGDTPDLSTLLKIRDRAMACFPTCAKNESALWHLFVFNDRAAAAKDHRRFLSGAAFDPETAVFMSSGFMPPESKLRGCSWQLAAQIAQKLAPRFRGELASRWLITGEVDGPRIRRVAIGVKRELFENTRRKILLPRENQTDVDASGDIRPVETVEQALRVIDGQGFENTIISLPAIRDLHILVGGARNPVIAGILLIYPTRVFLWCSDETLPDAQTIAGAIRKMPCGKSMQIDIGRMDSHDLQLAYDAIDHRIGEVGGTPENTLICNTGGNRLMGTAALLAANSRNLTVVYRDLNAAPDVLTALKLGENNRYQSGDAKINRCPFKERIDWTFLYAKDPVVKIDADALLAKILPVGTPRR